MSKWPYIFCILLAAFGCTPSSSETDKYIALQFTLDNITGREKAANNSLFEEIKFIYENTKYVKHSKAEEVKAWFDISVRLHQETDSLVLVIEDLKRRLEEQAGGRMEGNVFRYAHAETTEPVKALYYNDTLKTIIEKIISFKQQYIADTLLSMPVINVFAETSLSDFQGATLVAALAMLAHAQAELKQFESQWLVLALKQLNKLTNRIEEIPC